MKNEFQYRLQKSLSAANMTASELSEKTGISEANISNYVNGKYVAKQDKCYAMAVVLGVDPGWLMTGEEPTTKILNDAFRDYYEENGYPETGLPKTQEARIISEGIDKMDPVRREQALRVMQAIFSDIFDGSVKG